MFFLVEKKNLIVWGLICYELVSLTGPKATRITDCILNQF
jgi:hypothetical protein